MSRSRCSIVMIWCGRLFLSVGATLLCCEVHAFEEQDYCYRIEMKSTIGADETPLRQMVYLSPNPRGFDGSGRWQLVNSKRGDGFGSHRSVWFYNKGRVLLQWPLGVDFGFEVSLEPAMGDMSGHGSYYLGLRRSSQPRSVRAVRISCAQTYTAHIPAKCFRWSARPTSICHALRQMEAFRMARSATRRGAKVTQAVEVQD